MANEDKEAALTHRRRNKKKCLVYIAIGVVLQLVVIGVFGLIVLRIRKPSVKLNSVKISSLSNSTTPSPSFKMGFTAEIAVKNKNFGHYKFKNSTVIVSYHGMAVGEAPINATRTRARSTRRINISMDLSSTKLSGNSNLNTDLSSGMLPLIAHTKLSGKVHLLKIMKKGRSTEMNCTMVVNLKNQTIHDLNCK